MGGHRPFDDDRFPDEEGFAACFLCGKPVDPLDPKRGTYAITPPDIRLPMHIPCALPHWNGKTLDIRVESAYRIALDDMERRQRAIFFGR